MPAQSEDLGNALQMGGSTREKETMFLDDSGPLPSSRLFCGREMDTYLEPLHFVMAFGKYPNAEILLFKFTLYGPFPDRKYCFLMCFFLVWLWS
jgi:hypothetical protein